MFYKYFCHHTLSNLILKSLCGIFRMALIVHVCSCACESGLCVTPHVDCMYCFVYFMFPRNVRAKLIVACILEFMRFVWGSQLWIGIIWVKLTVPRLRLELSYFFMQPKFRHHVHKVLAWDTCVQSYFFKMDLNVIIPSISRSSRLPFLNRVHIICHECWSHADAICSDLTILFGEGYKLWISSSTYVRPS
jgi:hypothetical protein